MKLRSFPGLLSIVAITLSACHSSEIANSRDAAPDAIYMTYSLEWTEGNPTAECVARFRMGGEMGTTLVLSKPSQVTLDGEAIGVDSTRMGGAFYQANRPLASFSGQHTWEYTDITGKKYSHQFSFQPFSLTSPVPPAIDRSDLVLPFTGLKEGEILSLVISDTSSRAGGVIREVPVKNGRIVVSAAEMAKLSNGPITIRISQESRTPLKEATREGGHFNQALRLKPIETVLRGKGF